MGWKIWDSNSGKRKTFFSCPECPDWLRGPPSLLFNGYCVRQWCTTSRECSVQLDKGCKSELS